MSSPVQNRVTESPTDSPQIFSHVASIHRYPVKGLQGEDLHEAVITTRGLKFDRYFALAHDRVPLQSFGKWSTFEAFIGLDGAPRLAGFRAEIGWTGDLVMSSPDGELVRFELDATDAIVDNAEVTQTVSRWFSTPTESVRLVAGGTGYWDLEDAPISIISLPTLRAVAAAAGEDAIDPHRFRANLCLDGFEPWYELNLVGKHVKVGECVLEVLRPIERCRAITVNPNTPRNDINLLGTLAASFGHSHCGMYARVVHPGKVAMGDQLVVLGDTTSPTPSELTPRERAASPRLARVTSLTHETRDIVSVELEDSTGFLHTARTGQQVRLHIPGAGFPAWRNYTISRPGSPTRVTVRRVADGRFSPWVHSLLPNQDIVISGPYGDPFVHGDAELLVVTAGIGITPALAVASDPDLGGHRSRFIHVARSRHDVPLYDEFRRDVEGGGGELVLVETGNTTRDVIFESITNALADPASTVVLLCGPLEFERSVVAHLEKLGVSSDRIHSDPFYSPRDVRLEWREPTQKGPFSVDFTPAGGTSVDWNGVGTLLDLAESAGARVPSSCRAGVCGTCAVEPSGPTEYVLDPIAPGRTGEVYACCAVPLSNMVLRLPGVA